jgi:hypothetical protein
MTRAKVRIIVGISVVVLLVVGGFSALDLVKSWNEVSSFREVSTEVSVTVAPSPEEGGTG